MEKQDRLHALDAVRAFVLLLGIVLHATMSFIPGLGFPLQDSSPSASLSVTFYVIHIFRMSAFFMIAGFFAHLVFHRKGMAGFITDRRKRILMPLLVGWAVFFPLTALAIVWGVLRTSDGAFPEPPRPDVLLYFPLAHLWFLYVLLWLYALTLLARRTLDAIFEPSKLRNAVDGAIRKMLLGHWAAPILAAPTCAYLYFMRDWPMWAGIPTPEHSLIPTASALIAFGTAFVFGWLVHRQSEALNIWKQRWSLHLLLAIGFTIASLAIIDPEPARAARPDFGVERLAYVACYTLAIWYWTFGIIGAALRFCSRESSGRRYWADASYWMYLAHLPLVFALQAIVAPWSFHWSLKFPLILVMTTATLLLSYRYLVRPTYIGEVLNGRRYPRAAPLLSVHEPALAMSSASAALAIPSVFPDAMAMPLRAQPTPTSQPALARSGASQLASLHQAHKTFGKIKALNGVSLDVRSGELLAVLGPNGAGKSTAISLLLGLQQTESGAVTLFGSSPHELDARRRVGVMMQEVTLAPELCAREHIDLVCSYYPTPYSVQEVIELTHIQSLADRPYGKLSGGQKRQVQFAIAVCGRPQLLFLDEPTAGLDVQARAAMWETIRTLVRRGCSIVLTTHYLEEAEALADRVIVMAKGQVIAEGSVAQMRALVSKRRVSCITAIDRDSMRAWPEVESIATENDRVTIVSANAEAVVRRLLEGDPQLHELEVRRAGLSEAFAELTQENA